MQHGRPRALDILPHPASSSPVCHHLKVSIQLAPTPVLLSLRLPPSSSCLRTTYGTAAYCALTMIIAPIRRELPLSIFPVSTALQGPLASAEFAKRQQLLAVLHVRLQGEAGTPPLQTLFEAVTHSDDMSQCSGP